MDTNKLKSCSRMAARLLRCRKSRWQTSWMDGDAQQMGFYDKVPVGSRSGQEVQRARVVCMYADEIAQNSLHTSGQRPAQRHHADRNHTGLSLRRRCMERTPADAARETRRCWSRTCAASWRRRCMALSAAHTWQRKRSGIVKGLGVKVGRLSLCHCYHAKRDVCGLAYGMENRFTAISKHMAMRFTVKVTIAGPGHAEPLRVLKRSIRWTPEGVVCESDHRHACRFEQ